jgi:hypothetical protein
MQLALSSMQYVSTALAQSGLQGWMGLWLDSAWHTGFRAVFAAYILGATRGYLEGEEGDRSERSRSQSQHTASRGATAACSDSGADSNTADNLAVLQAEQTLQWCCLDVAAPMLAQLLQQFGDSNTAANSSSSSTMGSSSSSSGAAKSRRQHRRQSTVRSSAVSSEQWLPAALAPSMPVAFSSMLEQLGCSREVGLWLATKQDLGNSEKGGLLALLNAVSSSMLVGLTGRVDTKCWCSACTSLASKAQHRWQLCTCQYQQSPSSGYPAFPLAGCQH